MQSLDAYARIEERLASLPGMESASIGAIVPMGMISMGKSVQRAGVNPPPGSKPATPEAGQSFGAPWNAIGATYFNAMGVPVLQGRSFTQAEAFGKGAPPVAMLDETLARKLWPDGSALGQRIQWAAEEGGTSPVAADLAARRVAPSLNGVRIAVQEYGASNPDLLSGLEARGATVTRVPVYQWALPEDLEPLRNAIRALTGGEVDVVLFTTATQIVHLLQVAEAMGQADAAREALRRTVVASIGPTTSEELRQQGIEPDMEPSHPKMGFLVREAAEFANR